MSSPTVPANEPEATQRVPNSDDLLLECRPQQLIAERHDRLPFPNIGPVQEIAFDIGATSLKRGIELNGLVFRAFSGHQLLMEQRWPARIIRQRTGEEDLVIEAGTGLAIRALQFVLHGYEPLSLLEITALGKVVADDERVESVLHVPITFHTPATELHLPVRGAWWAIQASDWSDQHKREVFSQTYALDLVKLGADNHFFRGAGLELTDHYSWDQPVLATGGGKVAHVIYDMPDVAPGVQPDPRVYRDDPRRLLGNSVAISHGNGEFSYFGHLQQASVQVNVGEIIKRGTPIGRVGNSGQSPGPHLHVHLMEGPNLLIDRGLPMRFSHFSAGGQFFDSPTTIPTRMIVFGATNGEAEA